MLSFMKFKKVLGILTYYVLPALMIAFLAYGYFQLTSEEMKQISISFGAASFILITFILFVKPLSRFLPTIKPLQNMLMIRRELGVASFYFAITHVLGLFYSTGIFDHVEGWLYDWTGPLTTGLIATVFMIILGLTSNNFSAFRLKKNWKRVQYLAYPTFILVLVHKYGFRDSLVPAFVFSGIFIVLKILEFKGFVILKRKPKE